MNWDEHKIIYVECRWFNHRGHEHACRKQDKCPECGSEIKWKHTHLWDIGCVVDCEDFEMAKEASDEE